MKSCKDSFNRWEVEYWKQAATLDVEGTVIGKETQWAAPVFTHDYFRITYNGANYWNYVEVDRRTWGSYRIGDKIPITIGTCVNEKTKEKKEHIYLRGKAHPLCW